MRQWIADNKDLLIAVFGTGGIGAVLVAALAARKRGDSGSSSPAVSATATSGGVAAAHGGTGSIDLRVNETVGSEYIKGLQQRLGLSLAEAARLLQAFRDTGLTLAQSESVLVRISTHAEIRDALVMALRDEDAARVITIVAEYAASQQPKPSIKAGSDHG